MLPEQVVAGHWECGGEHVAEPECEECIWVPTRNRCGACGQFLRNDSTYINRCSDCWTPEDEFV